MHECGFGRREQRRGCSQGDVLGGFGGRTQTEQTIKQTIKRANGHMETSAHRRRVRRPIPRTSALAISFFVVCFRLPSLFPALSASVFLLLVCRWLSR